MSRKVLLLAGEESGLIYANGIAERLKARGDVEIRGYGDYGFEVADLAVFGYWAVIRKIGFFLRVKHTMERAIDEWRPDVVCTVDYPGMNLKLAGYAKARGIRAVHVVCPQVWAWKKGRIPKIEAALDKLCCFFPFEPKLFRKGLAEFVGHPLASARISGGRSGPPATMHGGSPATAPVTIRKNLIAVLPGSRIGEIEKHLPTMLKAVTLLKASGIACDYMIPAANERAFAAILRYADQSHVQHGKARELLQRANVAIVASGTATLEAALARCPTVLVYRVGPLLARFARLTIREIKHVGLANIIAEKAGVETPMPELLQEAFTAENIYNILVKWLSLPKERENAAERLDKTIGILESDKDALDKIVSFLL